MLRLLNFKCVSNAKLVLSPKTVAENRHQKFYTLFNHKSRLIKSLSRNQACNNSNQVSPEISKKIKKRKTVNYKRLCDMLEVTPNSAKHLQLEIKNLYSKRLQDFIDDEAKFEENEKKLKKQRKKKNSFTKTMEYQKFKVDRLQDENYPALTDLRDDPAIFIHANTKFNELSQENMNEIVESLHAFKEEPEVPEEVIDELETEIEERKVVSKTRKSKQYNGKYYDSQELERTSRQKSIGMCLNAYLDCCVTNGMINRAFLTILRYRNKHKHNPNLFKVEDINLINRLIHGYAEKENILKCKELMTIIEDDKIKPNEQTFANFLECIGRLSENLLAMQKYRLNDNDLMEMVEEKILQAKSFKISLNSIMNNSIFVSDQREAVLKAIRMSSEHFDPIYTPPALTYKNPLLNELNKNVQDIDFDPLKHLDTPVAGNEIMDSKTGFSRAELEDFARQQLDVELKGYVSIKSIKKYNPPTNVVLHYRARLDEIFQHWRERIIVSFNRDLNTLRQIESSKSHGDLNLLPYLRTLQVEDYVEIILNEARYLADGSETFSPTVSQLYKNLGSKVQIKYHKEQRKLNGVLQKTGEVYGDYCDVLAAGNSSDNPRQMWQRLTHQREYEGGPSMKFADTNWPFSAQIGVGRFLYNILIRDLKIDVTCLRMNHSSNITGNHLKWNDTTPAFYTLFRHQAKVVKEEVKPHPVLMKLLKGSQQESLTFEVNLVPMLCPPQPWTSPYNGGYLIAKTDLIRLPQTARQQIEQIQATPVENLYPALDSLNQLASIPWSVNCRVLDIVLEVFNKGGSAKLDVPEPPESLNPPETPENEASLDKTAKFELLRKRMIHRRRQGEMYSLWCDALYRLSLANHFRNRVFWLPHNMDFRGRVYPIPPHLNHLGSDLARSLLVFHQKKKLGIDGLMWLKLHCINLTGLKKRDSVRERLLYAEEVLDDILDSADNPLNGRKWWVASDEPWQTLSCCIEIANVIRSGDPENYESSFPIHQDGSCNGLQHYAALGRDSAGAFSVNLAPADTPQDVYSGIATLVEEARARDAQNGVQVAQKLEGFVKRKVIKQTVMTTVYGVTRFGARLQILKQLKDIEEFPQDWGWAAASYLTNKTFDSLQEMFTSTKQIQDWFTECARNISSTCGQTVQWVTPLGLPVVQPYGRHEKKMIMMKNLKLDTPFGIDSFAKPNIMKQKNAFPPNFIHSLDSSHMMLTSLYCEKAGLTFISVHDCFWTHACTVPEMNKICRNQFVALHSLPILEDLSKYLVEKYQFKHKDFVNDGSVGDMSKQKLNRILTQVPEKGDFDLQNVLKSVYFFS